MYLQGNLLFTKEKDEFTTLEKGCLQIENGHIVGVYESAPEGVAVVDYGDALLIPGFVDLHLHAPQYKNCGLGLDMELLPWLETYTFPEEARFADPAYAKTVYSRYVHDLWKNGTTRSVAFASIDYQATKILLELYKKAGLGAYVGKPIMDTNCPDYYRQDTRVAIEETAALLEEYSDEDALVKAIITPRFVPTSSHKAMEETQKLVEKYAAPVQSHLNENQSEIEWVGALYPEHPTYATVYDHYGQLGKTKTIMAHCVHNPQADVDLLKARGVFVAHCPHSNANVGSGIMPLTQMMDQGLKIGLGSDISGGHRIDMPSVIVSAMQMAFLQNQSSGRKDRPLKLSEAFYLATKGGGAFFGKVGSFEVGYEADLLVIEDDKTLRTGLSLEQRLSKQIYTGSGNDITARYVRGRLLDNPMD